MDRKPVPLLSPGYGAPTIPRQDLLSFSAGFRLDADSFPVDSQAHFSAILHIPEVDAAVVLAVGPAILESLVADSP